MKLTLRISPFALPIALAACGVSSGEEPARGPAAPASKTLASVDPAYYDGNPTCADLGLIGYSEKFDPPNSGTHSLGTSDSVTMTTDGTYVDWSATIGIDAVIVKGGSNANVYFYNESTGDTQLASPINPNTGVPYGLSHVDFCYDWEVKVSKTADTSFKRTYAWSIDKSASVSELLLSPGQSYVASYGVTVDVTGYTDSDWAVAGTITVSNPDPSNAATVMDVSDLFAGGALAVSCPVALPTNLGPGESLVCTYGGSLSGAIDGTNTATASTQGLVGSGQGSAAVSFGSASVTKADACVNVSDDKYGALGTVCEDAAPASFSYQMNIGPYAACGIYPFDNTASFTSDGGATGSDSWTITSTVPCSGGCSLTPGYWKTHSSYGPAPYDDTWALLPLGADTPFYLSGKTYYQVLWTQPLGSAYYILAHAYIAAKLNGLNGADTSAIASVLASAEAIFSAYTPVQVTLWKGAKRQAVIDLAKLLDNYNNGLIGPGHCSE